MSKAFTKEGDAEDGLVIADRGLPPGVPNYVTEAGYQRLLAAVQGLRARAGSSPDPRAELLARRLDSAVVVAEAEPGDRARFGSRVRVRLYGPQEREQTYQLVGIDEADEREGRLSWRSPLGQALLGAGVGDVLEIETPRGALELEVLALG